MSVSCFTALLSQLESKAGQLTPHAEDYLAKHARKLSLCANPFGQPSQTSKNKLEAGKIIDETGEVVILGENEKQLAKSVAERYLLNEEEAAFLLRAWRRHRGEDVNKDLDAALNKEDGFWSNITGFVFEERLSLIQVVAFLLRIGQLRLFLEQSFMMIVKGALNSRPRRSTIGHADNNPV